LILLLDEPGLGLHAAAQGDLLRFIDQRLAPDHQVIYTTHSPFLVNPTKIERARTVEDKDGEGTKISKEVLSVSRDTLFPLQASLGYHLAQTLFIGEDNLIVEGPSDFLYLEILSNYLRDKGRTALDARWVIVPAGGVDKIPTLSRFSVVS
jgi:predicted ATP-dependent endonuclease of OLD family